MASWLSTREISFHWLEVRATNIVLSNTTERECTQRKGPLAGQPFRVQLGSTWKTVIYASALQLGWTPSDHLDNYNNMFKYSTTYYFPRADHVPKTDTTHLQWAGTMSENRLVYGCSLILQKTLFEQKKEIAEKIGLIQQEGESKKVYKKRLGLDIRKVWIPSLTFEKQKKRFF